MCIDRRIETETKSDVMITKDTKEEWRREVMYHPRLLGESSGYELHV